MDSHNELHMEKKIERILKQEVEIPVPVTDRIEETLAGISRNAAVGRKTESGGQRGRVKSIEQRGKGRGKKKRFFGAAAAAAVLLCTSITAVAAVIFHWNHMVIDKFEIDEVQQERLVEDGVAPVVDASVADQGVTVSMEQALMDSRYIYLLLKIEAPEDMTLSEYIFFDHFVLTLDGQESDFSYCAGIVDDNPSDNISYWEIWVDNSVFKHDFHNKTLGIQLENMRDNVIGGEEGNKLADGRWHLDWKMVYEDSETVFEINKLLPELGAAVKSISLSPVSIEVLYDWEQKKVPADAIDENGKAFVTYEYAEPPVAAAFRMKDGSRQVIDISGPGSVGYTEESSTEYHWSFGMGKVVNVDEIEAVIFIDPASGTEEEAVLR